MRMGCTQPLFPGPQTFCNGYSEEPGASVPPSKYRRLPDDTVRFVCTCREGCIRILVTKVRTNLVVDNRVTYNPHIGA